MTGITKTYRFFEEAAEVTESAWKSLKNYISSNGMTNQEYHRNYLYLHILNECSKPDEVLEIGCGDGTGDCGILGPPMIAKKVYDYVCIDKKRYNNPPFNFVQADIEEYGLTGLYDKIIALYVVQYINAFSLFRLVSEHLAPGGKAYFSEGLNWVHGGERLQASEICELFRQGMAVFDHYEIFGIEDGIIVPENGAKTGVFAIGQNNESSD